MRVTMTKTMKGSENGIHVKQYEEGQTYEMGEDLAKSFLKSKCAKPAPEPEPEPKQDEGGDQTKQGKGPDENK